MSSSTEICDKIFDFDILFGTNSNFIDHIAKICVYAYKSLTMALRNSF